MTFCQLEKVGSQIYIYDLYIGLLTICLYVLIQPYCVLCFASSGISEISTSTEMNEEAVYDVPLSYRKSAEHPGEAVFFSQWLAFEHLVIQKKTKKQKNPHNISLLLTDIFQTPQRVSMMYQALS